MHYNNEQLEKKGLSSTSFVLSANSRICQLLFNIYFTLIHSLSYFTILRGMIRYGKAAAANSR